MQTESINPQDLPEQLSDILLIYNHKKMKIEAVKGIGKNGELETVPPTQKNANEFMRVDKNGDIFSNFFKNFFSQLKNPTQFSFFKIPAASVIEKAVEIKEAIEKPSPEGDQVLLQHKVKTDLIKPQQKEESTKQDQSPNQNTMENNRTSNANESNPSASEYRYKADDIDWETMSNLGLSREKLETMKILDPLLRGYKTNELVPISLNLGTAITRLDARLSLQQNAEGKVVMSIHGIRKSPNLNYAFLGHEFSKEDKDNLLKIGNMGRVVELTNPKTNEKISSLISLDSLTNELVAVGVEKIKIPDEIKGVKLNEAQKQTLIGGKPLFVENMMSGKGAEFSAYVQYNADKRYVEFLFNKDLSAIQKLTGETVQSVGLPKVFRGKELDEQQYSKLKDGETVYIDGLLDKKGKAYQGYLTLNKESGQTEFSFKNPDKLKELVKPIEEHKTQVAVNSDGKTNEATKHIKEPLKSKQTAPDSAEQKVKQKAQVKPGRRKI